MELDPQEVYIEMLTDFIYSKEKYRDMMDTVFAKISDDDVHKFTLYIFSIADALHHQTSTKRFTGKQLEYYNKVVEIEEYLFECFTKIDRVELFSQTVSYYSGMVGSA